MKRIFYVALVLMLALCLVCCDKQQEQPESEEGVAFFVRYNGVKIELGKDADAVVEALGAPQDTREIGDCGGLGAQIKYSYPSLEIYSLQNDKSGNVVDQITLRDDSVTTPEGVYIGMSEAETLEKLGEPTSRADSLEYAKGSYLLKITLKDGTVNEIDYMTVSQ